MGFFSWKTSDTQETIWNEYQDLHPVKTVYLLLPHGKESVTEESYGGYGNFGGVDAYEMLYCLNNPNNKEGSADYFDSKEFSLERKDGTARANGIDIAFDGSELKYPLKFSFDKGAVYEELPKAKNCETQGFF